MPKAIQRVLPGLHRGKTAMITGGSLGIGLQLGRYLAMAGARVLLSARSPEKLETARENIVAELRRIGYSDAEDRVLTMSGVDVGDEAAMDALFKETVERFGHLDFLINNAGIAGAEEMVVDMDLDAWNYTMEANLISNYSLIRKFAPLMKARGSGTILNVSSYFGGEKYVSVAYPNRADYAVSKAGQRALAEILSRHLGPEIRINAMAPGPVDGARLRGLGGAPGLFARRGRLIMENVRLNRVHAAILASLNDMAAADLLERLADNAIEKLDAWHDAPEPLLKLMAQVAEGKPDANATHFLLGKGMPRKLTDRLVAGRADRRRRGGRFRRKLRRGARTVFRAGRYRAFGAEDRGRHPEPPAPAPHADRRGSRPVDGLQPRRRQRQRRNLPSVGRPQVRPLRNRRRDDVAAGRRGSCGTQGQARRPDGRRDA